MVPLRCARLWLLLLLWTGLAPASRAVILWSDLGATLVHQTGPGTDILGSAVKRDDTASDTLYFKFHVDPMSDVSTEEYFAGFQLYEGETDHLGVGNSQAAWAYSAFKASERGQSNNVFGDVDLNSARPESFALGEFRTYELPRRGIESTIVFKVQFVPGGDDLVTVWLNPDLGPGATEAGQATNITTRFKANASFDQIRLRHGGGGGGWTFSDMAIATAFADFVNSGSPELGGAEATNAVPRLTFRTWQREQGLPQNSIRALAQTRDGYLWIGSDDGVARFDGVRFVTLGLREGLRSDRVRVLYEDSHGALWIGTMGGGLACWQGGQLATLTLQDGLPADSITALVEDNEDRLWVGTEAGLVVREKTNSAPRLFGAGKAPARTPAQPRAARFTRLEGAEPLAGRVISTLFKDRRGTIWVGATGAGLFRYTGGKFTRLVDPSVEALLLDPHSLLVDRADRIWVGAGDDFVLCREGTQWRRYRVPRHLARPVVRALAEEADGTVWAGSVSEGLIQFKAGKLTAVNANSGLPDNVVEALLVDREGNLWVGTGAGLTRLRRSNLSVFGQTEGLGYGAVQGLAEVAPGILWAAKPGDRLYRWDGRKFSPLNAGALAQRYADMNTLLLARDGSCWAGTAQGLLHFRDPAASSAEAEPAALAGLNVTALAEGRDARLWAGTREGSVWSMREGAWTMQTNLSQPHPITALLPDRQGNLWIGSEGSGLCRVKDGTCTYYRKGAGLLSDLVRALYADTEGRLWVGTAGGGLSRWRDGQMATFTTREGLPDNTISQILEDDAARLWLGNNRGLACVAKGDLEDLATGKVPAVYPQVYGRAEGMLAEECTGGFSPAGLKTSSGRLCFSTLKGMVVVDPRPRQADAPAPTVVLEEVMVDGVAAELTPAPTVGVQPPGSAPSAGIRVVPGKHRFEFRYTGISFNAPDRVRFRYRLEGLEPDWVDAGTRRTAFYSYLPHGQYRFRVSACNSAGVWNEDGASLPLTVPPHFWQTWWFIGLAAIALLGSVAGSARVVEKRKLQRRLQNLEQERTLQRERARIAQDLHDDLGSSLTRISLLSDLVKADKDNPAQIEVHAQKLSQSAAQTVRALEEIVWALRPGSDSLQSLVEYIAHFGNELFDGDKARCRLDLPPDLPARALPPEMRHNIFLIVKEALTNALKHAQAKEVHVLAKASDHSLEIRVQDDGEGFKFEGFSAASRRQGLGNMRRRAEAMGGTLTVDSAPGKGTTVTLAVSFPAAYPPRS